MRSTGTMINAQIGDKKVHVFFASLPRVNDTVIVDGRTFSVSAVVWETNEQWTGSRTVLHPTVQLARVWSHEPEETWRDLIGVDLSKLLKHGLSVRAHNALKRAGYKYIQDVSGPREDDLLATRDFGEKSLKELEQAIVSWDEPS